jgi:hypothetical protein
MLKRLREAGYVEGAGRKLTYLFQDHTALKLTEKGLKHIVWKKGICVGRRDITEIIEYTDISGPQAAFGTKVTYGYELIMSDIVTDLGIEDVVKAKLPGTDEAWFVKTNKGWRMR